VYSNSGKDSIKIRDFSGGNVSDMRTIQKTELVPPYYYDWMFSDQHSILSKIEESGVRLIKFGECENACATSDAYKLKPFIEDFNDSLNSDDYFKIANTGTIGRYVPRWGAREMVYLGDRYLKPVVEKSIFLREFSNSYGRKSENPKLIMKGLNLLDVFIDENGDFIPGKTTLIVTADHNNSLKLLLALLNHPIAIFYFKERFPAASYNKGTAESKLKCNTFKNRRRYAHGKISSPQYHRTHAIQIFIGRTAT
jgi:hypothetical protein